MDCFASLAMTEDRATPLDPVVLRESGGPSTPRLLGSIIAVSGILGPRLRGDDNCGCDTHLDVLATHCARALPETSRPLKQRAQGRPGARCTRGLVCGLHKTKCTRAYRAAVNTRPSLRNGFTAYAELSPETSSCLTPSPPVQLTPLRQLDTCNGCQDHTVLPYAYPRHRLSANRVHRNPSNVRDDGRRPSEWDGMAIDAH